MFFTRLLALEQARANDRPLQGRHVSRPASRWPICAADWAAICMALGERGPGRGRRSRSRHDAAGRSELPRCRAMRAAERRDWPRATSPRAGGRARAAWHIDPDRRPTATARRSSNGRSAAGSARRTPRGLCPHAAMKLAPAAEPPERWQEEAELELDRPPARVPAARRLARRAGPEPGRRAATVLDAAGEPHSLVGDEANRRWPRGSAGISASRTSAVLAAGLAGALAREHELAAVACGIAYLHGRAPATGPAGRYVRGARCPLARSQEAQARLRERGIGRVEVKKRGIDHRPRRPAAELAARDEVATLLVYHDDAAAQAVLAQRVARNRLPGADGWLAQPCRMRSAPVKRRKTGMRNNADRCCWIIADWHGWTSQPWHPRRSPI